MVDDARLCDDGVDRDTDAHEDDDDTIGTGARKGLAKERNGLFGLVADAARVALQ